MGEEQDEARDTFPDATQTGRATSPPVASLRQRPLGRASTFAESAPRFARRGSSAVSESLSETRRSLKESTDDLLLPRASADQDTHLETSHWHSLPLGLALLPALGGLFFNNGSAFVTDISLLGLAALFLNWAVRLPWDWYSSAQAVVSENESQEIGSAIEDDSVDLDADTSLSSEAKHDRPLLSDRALKAQHELRVHELLALLACFAFPALGAWLLHAIRSQLSSRSESLISNYNLTIFLLASEVRPLSHLIKLVQRRTLFLQRTISASAEQKHTEQLDPKIAEMSKRLEELESHIADTVMITTKPDSGTPSQADEFIARASTQANADLRKSFQPELDALNRAMRRYEKRTMTSAIQVETRLQDLEAKIQDVVILAAATQRNADKQYGKHLPILLDWMSASVVVPVQYAIYVLTLPQRTLTAVISWVKVKLGFASKSSKPQNSKISPRTGQKRRSSKEIAKT